MLIDFFFTLKDARIPVSIKEFQMLLEAKHKSVIAPSLDEYYYLSRMALVKDEAHYDKFDKAFGLYFKGVNATFEKYPEIPLEWLRKRMEHEQTPKQRTQNEKNNNNKQKKHQKEKQKEQKERHEGGGKWIGTGGT